MRQLKAALIILSVYAISGGNITNANVSSCGGEATEWIEKLSSPREEILLGHSIDKCSYGATWVQKFNDDKMKDRDRSCKDHILIYTHKKCVYFRDYIDPAAYTPCKAWSRSMYGRCMEGDAAWFRRTP